MERLGNVLRLFFLATTWPPQRVSSVWSGTSGCGGMVDVTVAAENANYAQPALDASHSPAGGDCSRFTADAVVGVTLLSFFPRVIADLHSVVDLDNLTANEPADRPVCCRDMCVAGRQHRLLGLARYPQSSGRARCDGNDCHERSKERR